MPDPKDILFAVLCGVLPAIAAALVLFGVGGKRCLGLALGAALLAAASLLQSALPILPHVLYQGGNDYKQWLCWSVIAAGVLALPTGARFPPVWLAVPVGLALLGSEIWFMLTNLRGRMETAESVLKHGVPFVLMGFTWLALARTAARRDGVALALALGVCMCGDAAVLMLGGSALLSQLAGTMAAVWITAAVTALWHRPLQLGVASMLAFVAAHGGLLLAGALFSDLPYEVAAIAAVAPASLLVAGGLEGRAKLRLFLGLVLLLAIYAGAVWLSWLVAHPS
jgi:hypothetical protein